MMHRMLQLPPLLAIIGLLGLAAGCASSTVVPDVGDDVQDGADFAPKPYGSRQLRAALPTGSAFTIRNEADGEVTLDEFVVVETDREYCTMEHRVTTEDGKLIEELGETEFAWNELRDHAAFPAEITVRSEGHLDVPVGSHDTWLYVVTDQNDEGLPQVTYYHFAKELPGPPILMTVVVDGKLALTRTMVARR